MPNSVEFSYLGWCWHSDGDLESTSTWHMWANNSYHTAKSHTWLTRRRSRKGMVRFNQTLAEDSQHLPYKTHRLRYFSPPKIHKRRRRADRVTQTGNVMLRTWRSDLRFQKTGIVANPNALASGQRWQPFRLQHWRCLLPEGRNSAYSLLFFSSERLSATAFLCPTVVSCLFCHKSHSVTETNK